MCEKERGERMREGEGGRNIRLSPIFFVCAWMLFVCYI